MKKFALKLLLAAFFCILAFSLAACMRPVDYDEFQREIGEEERVTIGAGSEPGLIAGNKLISGLDPNKYYMVEEIDLDGNSNITFVRSTGVRWQNLGEIGRVSGRAITNLENDNTYIVKAATSLFANGTDLTYFDLESGKVPSNAANKAKVQNGAITLSAPSEKYYLNVAPAVNHLKNYEIMMIPVEADNSVLTWDYKSRVSAYNTAGGTIESIISASYTSSDTSTPPKTAGIYQFRTTTVPAYLNGMSLIELWEEDTTADYVIVERDSTDNSIMDFKVLRVTIEPKQPEIVININVNITLVDGSLNITYTPTSPPDLSIQYSKTATDVIINASISGLYSEIKWYFDGEEVGNTPILSLKIVDHILLSIIGDHELTVEVSNGIIWHSAIIPIKVTP